MWPDSEDSSSTGIAHGMSAVSELGCSEPGELLLAKEKKHNASLRGCLCRGYLVPLLISPITIAKINFEKLLTSDKFSKTHKFNLMQPSSSLSILACFCICCVINTFF